MEGLDYELLNKFLSIEPKKDKTPIGSYLVNIENIEITKSKAGNTMLKCVFNIISGRYRGNRLYMYRVIKNTAQNDSVVRFLRSLGCPKELNINFYGIDHLTTSLVPRIARFVVDKIEYQLKYSKTDMGWDDFYIESIIG